MLNYDDDGFIYDCPRPAVDDGPPQWWWYSEAVDEYEERLLDSLAFPSDDC